MDDKEYYESVMHRYDTYGKGHSLRSYCNKESIDYNWVLQYRRDHPKEVARKGKTETATFLPLEITEEASKPKTWEVENLTLKTDDGEFIQIKTNSLTTATMLLNKISLP